MIQLKSDTNCLEFAQTADASHKTQEPPAHASLTNVGYKFDGPYDPLWRAGKSSMQSTESQRLGHDLAIEQQQQWSPFRCDDHLLIEGLKESKQYTFVIIILI